MNAPTTRETADMYKNSAKTNTSAEHVKTADHAELAALCERLRSGRMTDGTRIRAAMKIEALLSEIAALRGGRESDSDDWAENLAELRAESQRHLLRATQAERQRDELRRALERQCDNMSFVLNRVELHAWADKFSREVAEDRALLANQGADQ